MTATFATWTTLAVRVPQLMSGTMAPAEAKRMVSEKVAAAIEGGIAGAVEAQRRLGTASSMTPAGMMRDMAAIMTAAARPAQRTV